MATHLICNNCDWMGDPSELVSLTEEIEDRDFSYCPICDSNDLDEDEDEGVD